MDQAQGAVAGRDLDRRKSSNSLRAGRREEVLREATGSLVAGVGVVAEVAEGGADVRQVVGQRRRQDDPPLDVLEIGDQAAQPRGCCGRCTSPHSVLGADLGHHLADVEPVGAAEQAEDAVRLVGGDRQRAAAGVVAGHDRRHRAAGEVGDGGVVRIPGRLPGQRREVRESAWRRSAPPPGSSRVAVGSSSKITITTGVVEGTSVPSALASLVRGRSASRCR